MAETSQGRVQVRQELDCNRAASGVRRELEGMGFRPGDVGDNEKIGVCSPPRDDSGGAEMSTIKALIGGTIIALLANALIPEIPKGLEAECQAIQDCLPSEMTSGD